MKNIDNYILEKLHLNKDTFVFDETKFKNSLENTYKISSDSILYKVLLPWFKKYSVINYKAYGWVGINSLMGTDNAYSEDKNELQRLAKELIKNGKQESKYEDKVFYTTPNLCGMFNPRDIMDNIAIIFQKENENNK